MELEIKYTYIITFSEEEFRLFLGGIGATSVNSRVDAGMTIKQSEFFASMYENLDI